MTGILLSCASCAKNIKAVPGGEGHQENVLIQFYQGPLNHLSSVRYAECPMYPSCSEYSRQCFRKYNYFTAWMMIFDRLIRCGHDEIELSPKVWVNGKWKYYDPLENNDFWWLSK